MRREPQTQTIDVPPLSIRADVASVNDEKRTVDLIFSTGAAVDRMDFWTGKRYIERLSLKPEHIKLDRLNAGAPLLDSHSAWSLSDQIGVVVTDSARVVKNEARATVRFSKRDQVDPIWQDVRDGIIKSVSVGYLVHRYEETTGKEGSIPTRLATDWQPYEISFVSMPADVGARVRSGDKTGTNPCVILTRAVEELPMDPENPQSETLVERDPLDPGASRLALAPAEAPAPNERDLGADAERSRVQGIILACRAARMTQAFADAAIAGKKPLVSVQSEIFVELGRREPDAPREGARSVEITGTPDRFVHERNGIMNSLLHRVAPDFFKLEEIGRKYRGMTLLDIARTFLQARGTRTTDLSRMELAGLALGLTSRGGMHTTSDFALLMADVANKTLRAAYEEAEQTFKAIGRRVTLPDFKLSNRMQLGDAPALLEVKEHGEFTRGTIAESKEALQLKTFGRVFAITRQTLVNDDTDAFSRVPTAFGRSARTLESDIVWQQITSNPVMGDGVVLFHATHGNLDAAASVISVASLGKGRAAMRVQKGIDGVTVLNIAPKYLGLPAALETTAATFLVQITPAQPSNVNPFAGILTPLVEPRLDANSATAWYLFAGAGTDVIEYAYLEGEEGPMVESRIGFDIDGLEIKCRLDFAAKVIDWRGVWKNPGV